MNPRERGFLLLSDHLGDPSRRVLTQPQLRTLAQRLTGWDRPVEDRDLSLDDLIQLGYGQEMAVRILTLLNEEDRLDHYLHKAMRAGCRPVTRISDGYPLILRKRLGLDSPGCLWVKGDISLLSEPGIALVGSRELAPGNREFAREVGRQAAHQGLVLISGNARGADREAQDACLEAGGRVVSIVADDLLRHPSRENLTYVSEDGFDLPFSAQRALSRNRVIHALGRMVFVAQTRMEEGGTWAGVTRNLREGWSMILGFRDGSEGMQALEQRGAYLVGVDALSDLTALIQPEMNLFHR